MIDTWASAAGGGAPPWIFIHGTDIVDRGLIVLFFSPFSVGTPLEEAYWCYFLVFLCYFLVFFPLRLSSPLKNFLPTPLARYIPTCDIFCFSFYISLSWILMSLEYEKVFNSTCLFCFFCLIQNCLYTITHNLICLYIITHSNLRR